MTSLSLNMGQVIRKRHSSSTRLGYIGHLLWLLSILDLSLLPSSIMRLWSDVRILVMATLCCWHSSSYFSNLTLVSNDLNVSALVDTFRSSTHFVWCISWIIPLSLFDGISSSGIWLLRYELMSLIFLLMLFSIVALVYFVCIVVFV